MAKRKKVPNKTKHKVPIKTRKRVPNKAKNKVPIKAGKRVPNKAKKPTRKSRRQKKLAPICNGLFCSDPGCNHGKKDNKVNKTNNDSKKCSALKRIQKPAIAKKKPVKRRNRKPVKCQKKKNKARRRRPLTDYNLFVSHVCKRCRDAGIKQTGTSLIKQASKCWKALTPQQKAVFKCGGTEDTQTFKAGPAPGSPPAPGPAPENPPQAPQPAASTPNTGTGHFVGTRPRPANGLPYFLNGNKPFF